MRSGDAALDLIQNGLGVLALADALLRLNHALLDIDPLCTAGGIEVAGEQDG